MIEVTLPLIISVLSLALTLFKYLDKSKEKINKALTDIELLKLKVEQVCSWGDHVEQDLKAKLAEQQKQSERLSDKLDDIRDKLNE